MCIFIFSFIHKSSVCVLVIWAATVKYYTLDGLYTIETYFPQF